MAPPEVVVANQALSKVAVGGKELGQGHVVGRAAERKREPTLRVQGPNFLRHGPLLLGLRRFAVRMLHLLCDTCAGDKVMTIQRSPSNVAL